MKPGRMNRKEGPAGQRGSLFKGFDSGLRPSPFGPPSASPMRSYSPLANGDAAERLPGFIPPGEGRRASRDPVGVLLGTLNPSHPE